MTVSSSNMTTSSVGAMTTNDLWIWAVSSSRDDWEDAEFMSRFFEIWCGFEERSLSGHDD